MKLLFSFLIGFITCGIVFEILKPDSFITPKHITVDSLSFDLESGNYVMWDKGRTDTVFILSGK